MTEDIGPGRHIAPGEGEALWVGGERLTFKIRGAETGEAVAMVKDSVEPGYGPPPHIHLHENEIFYVVSGEFTFTLGDHEIPAPAGTVVAVPQGRLHSFRNIGTESGKLFAVVWPAVAFEGFVTEAGTPEPLAGPPDLEKLLAAATRHGIVVPPPSDT